MTPKLPSPHQQWSHSTCTTNDLIAALDNPSITAIEADLVMGTTNTDNTIVPIMAHPPTRHSDLTVQAFLQKTMTYHKHVKLDFKDSATLPLVLGYLRESVRENDATIFLNADILEGPGKRGDATIDAEVFVETCLESLSGWHGNVALSLGWNVDCRSFFGYTQEDGVKMKDLILRYNVLERCQGLVLTVNARVLTKSCTAFDWMLREFPELQLLIWTGTGEPAISRRQIAGLQTHYEGLGLMDRVGFDCKIARSFLSGVFYDNAVRVVGVFWNILQYYRHAK